MVRISGRIDRIDLGTIAGESVFNVIDYKSGGTIRLDRDTIRAGATLQLPLYALAAMELILSDRVAVPWRYRLLVRPRAGIQHPPVAAAGRQGQRPLELGKMARDPRAGSRSRRRHCPKRPRTAASL